MRLRTSLPLHLPPLVPPRTHSICVHCAHTHTRETYTLTHTHYLPSTLSIAGAHSSLSLLSSLSLFHLLLLLHRRRPARPIARRSFRPSLSRCLAYIPIFRLVFLSRARITRIHPCVRPIRASATYYHSLCCTDAFRCVSSPFLSPFYVHFVSVRFSRVSLSLSLSLSVSLVLFLYSSSALSHSRRSLPTLSGRLSVSPSVFLSPSLVNPFRLFSSYIPYFVSRSRRNPLRPSSPRLLFLRPRSPHSSSPPRAHSYTSTCTHRPTRVPTASYKHARTHTHTHTSTHTL